MLCLIRVVVTPVLVKEWEQKEVGKTKGRWWRRGQCSVNRIFFFPSQVGL